MEVKRYEPYYISDQGNWMSANMGEDDDGDWVKYDDYAALRAELDAAMHDIRVGTDHEDRLATMVRKVKP